LHSISKAHYKCQVIIIIIIIDVKNVLTALYLEMSNWFLNLGGG